MSPAGETLQIDAVIVSADMAEMTLECVQHLESSAVASTIVVDNAFDDAAGACRLELAARATVVELDVPHGFASANNRGISSGSAPFVLLLNSDILVTPCAVEALAAELNRDGGVVAAGGRLVDPDTLETQPDYRPRRFPSLANFVIILLGIEELWNGNPLTRRYHGDGLDDSRTQEVQQPAAAALLVRRTDMESIGGFDERFWFWFEDSDLLLRLSARGRILYVPRAVFRHLGGGTFQRWDKSRRIRSVHHGMLHYGDAHFSRRQRFLLGAVTVAISAPRVALFARSRPAEAQAWRAVADGGLALLMGRPVPAIAPGPGLEPLRPCPDSGAS